MSRTSYMLAPKQKQEGNLPILDDPLVVEELFEAVDRYGGVITRACKELGISFHAVHRHKLRDVQFARDLALKMEDARNSRAIEMMDLADQHVKSHLVQTFEPLLNEVGLPVLDDDFEPVMVSKLPLKSAVEARREYRQQLDGSDGVSIAIQNVAEASSGPRNTVATQLPKLIQPVITHNEPSGFPMATGIEDAEIITENVQEAPK